MINNSRLIFSALLMFVLSGCDTTRISEEVRNFEDRSWLYTSPERFDFNINDISIEYNLNLYLRYTNNYPFSNIYLRYQLMDSLDSKKVEGEVKNVELFNPKDGKPIGKSSIGDIYEIKIPVTSSHKFDTSGPYALRVRQFMRRDTLNELVSVGLRIERASN